METVRGAVRRLWKSRFAPFRSSVVVVVVIAAAVVIAVVVVVVVVIVPNSLVLRWTDGLTDRIVGLVVRGPSREWQTQVRVPLSVFQVESCQ